MVSWKKSGFDVSKLKMHQKRANCDYNWMTWGFVVCSNEWLPDYKLEHAPTTMYLDPTEHTSNTVKHYFGFIKILNSTTHKIYWIVLLLYNLIHFKYSGVLYAVSQWLTHNEILIIIINGKAHYKLYTWVVMYLYTRTQIF